MFLLAGIVVTLQAAVRSGITGAAVFWRRGGVVRAGWVSAAVLVMVVMVVLALVAVVV